MEITVRGLCNVLHGMFFGGFFLMGTWGGLTMLWHSVWSQPASHLPERAHTRETVYWCVAAALGWAAVLTGTYLIYPWYRSPISSGVSNLMGHPKFLLLSDPSTVYWHTVGMEWKEHIAFFAPILTTAVAYLVWLYRGELSRNVSVRRAAIGYTATALLCAGVAGVFGALIDKVAPVQGGKVLAIPRSIAK